MHSGTLTTLSQYLLVQLLNCKHFVFGIHCLAKYVQKILFGQDISVYVLGFVSMKEKVSKRPACVVSRYKALDPLLFKTALIIG